jgi:hypothetical protein
MSHLVLFLPFPCILQTMIIRIMAVDHDTNRVLTRANYTHDIVDKKIIRSLTSTYSN